MTHDDDTAIEAWYDALAGRNASESVPSPHDEAVRTLRQTLLALDRESAATENLDHDWERLRFRLRREGLLAKPLPYRPGAYWALAASLVLAVVLGIQVVREESPPEGTAETEVMRGQATTSIVLRVADPNALAARIAEACAGSGVPLKRRDDASGAILLDIAVPATVPAALADALKLHEFEVPAGKEITLVIMRAN